MCSSLSFLLQEDQILAYVPVLIILTICTHLFLSSSLLHMWIPSSTLAKYPKISSHSPENSICFFHFPVKPAVHQTLENVKKIQLCLIAMILTTLLLDWWVKSFIYHICRHNTERILVLVIKTWSWNNGFLLIASYLSQSYLLFEICFVSWSSMHLYAQISMSIII